MRRTAMGLVLALAACNQSALIGEPDTGSTACATPCNGICCAADETCNALNKCVKKVKPCIPQCTDRDCGPDTCGGQCGAGCHPGHSKCDDASGLCVSCSPQCGTAKCGDDQCGATCGNCKSSEACRSGQCVSCTRACGTHDCGDDGCDGSCGQCDTGKACLGGVCTSCTPSCGVHNCGDDGCGGSCGNCASGKACQSGVCTSCTPSCGVHNCGDDGCGGSCGKCATGKACQSGTCVSCSPETDAQFCVRQGKNCDPLTGTDNCGSPRTADCGACRSPSVCASGVCSGTCVPESDADLCEALGRDCGPATGTDNCNNSRSVDCGGCTGGKSCNNGKCTTGTCTPESDVDFCARLGKACGKVTDFDNCGTARTVASCGSCTGAGQSCELGACCSPETQPLAQPLDMYVMLDRSGSMTDALTAGGTKWSAVTTALKSFFGQANLFGVSAGLQFFPLKATTSQTCPSTCAKDADCGICGPCVDDGSGTGKLLCTAQATGESCTPADYAKPAVEISALPAAATSLDGAMSLTPEGSTPTYAALSGAIDHAKAWATKNPTHPVVVILATDGEPTECDVVLADIQAVAAGGATNKPAILTYVIGVGSSLSNLNAIASAGGTSQAFLVDTTQDVTSQFLAALNTIRANSSGTCTYPIPTPQVSVSYDKVNVQLTPGGSTTIETFVKVADKSHCPSTGDGWYYDDPGSPAKIILCDKACAKVTADTKGLLEVVFGCPSQK